MSFVEFYAPLLHVGAAVVGWGLAMLTGRMFAVAS
jgi:hypothetical protein